jgi:hypothetical protein
LRFVVSFSFRLTVTDGSGKTADDQVLVRSK